MTFIAHVCAENGLSLICLDAPAYMKKAVQISLQENMISPGLEDPYFILVRILEQVIILYDDSIWAIRNHVCRAEAVSWVWSVYCSGLLTTIDTPN
jgi:hypothetical protein